MNNGQVNPPNVVFDDGTAQWIRTENGVWYLELRLRGQVFRINPDGVRAMWLGMPSELKEGDDAADN